VGAVDDKTFFKVFTHVNLVYKPLQFH
jgi:hypothetical protein